MIQHTSVMLSTVMTPVDILIVALAFFVVLVGLFSRQD